VSIEEAHEALVIRPGDTLVLRFDRRLSEEEADSLLTTMRPRLPEDVKIMIIDNCAQIAAVRP
jgi:hypothetical protein